MDLFADWAATKHGMIDTLRAIIASGRLESDQMRSELVEIVGVFLDAGAAAGDIRADADATPLQQRSPESSASPGPPSNAPSGPHAHPADGRPTT